MNHIGIHLFDAVEELDAVGPWEVFGMWTRRWPDDGWQVVTFSEDGGPVECAKGMRILPEFSEAARPELDVLVYPGGQGTRPHWEAERFVDDGDVVTASGVSAGIDMALHLVARLAGTTRASQVRRAMQYDPAPPVPNARFDDR